MNEPPTALSTRLSAYDARTPREPVALAEVEPMPTVKGRCETCGCEIVQWEVAGFVYPRHCDAHESAAKSATMQAAEEQEKARRKARVAKVIPPLYREIALAGHRDYPAEAWKAIRRWQPGTQGIERAWGLLVFGETGKMKSTMVCHHVADVAIRTGASIAFLSVPEFETIQRLAWEKRATDEKMAARLQLKAARSAKILILDDLGKESSTEGIELALHGLIDYRITHLRPTIITLNANAAAYEARLSPERGKPFLRRLTNYNTAICVE